MTSPGTALATAAAFVWLGMVVAISFVEAPLKFRAPGVTLPIGLGIGRLVFRALNVMEVALAALLLASVAVGDASPRVVVAAAVPVGLLTAQLVAVRPRLTRRSNLMLAGADAPRSQAHLAYVALEVAKVVALLTAGALLLTR